MSILTKANSLSGGILMQNKFIKPYKITELNILNAQTVARSRFDRVTFVRIQTTQLHYFISYQSPRKTYN